MPNSISYGVAKSVGSKIYLIPKSANPIQIYDPAILGDPPKRRAMLDWLASLGTRFEDVIVWGTASDAELLLARGYRPDFRDGGLLLAHFVGCPVEIRVSVPGPAPHGLVVQYGFDPAQRPANEYLVPAGTVPEAGGFVFRPRACLCGPVWWRVALDVDGSDSPSAGDRFCPGAGPDGTETLVATEQQPPLACRIDW